MLWEQALAAFASSTQGDITTRDQVAGTGTGVLTWISSFDVVTSPGPSDVAAYQSTYDFYSFATYTTSVGTYTTVLGGLIDWTDLDAAGSDLYLFNHQPQNILIPLVWLPNQNDTTSVWSFDAAVTALQNIDTWLTGWATTVNGWADAVGDTGSDWQGSAAAEFKWTLLGIGNELQNLHLQLNTPTNRWALLQTARDALSSAQTALYNGWSDWNQSASAWPYQCLQQALANAMTGQSPTATVNETYFSAGDGPGTWDVSVTANFNVPGYGDPTTQAFWTAVEAAAKVLWQQNVADTMDAKATPAMNSLTTAYANAATKLGDLMAFSLPAPPASANTNVDGNANTDIGNSNIGSPNLNTNTSLDSTGNGGFTTSNTNTGMNVPNGNVNIPVTQTNTGTGNVNMTSTGNTNTPVSEDTVTGPNGKPITDPSTGDPLLVPAGSTIAADGEIIGPDGKPVLGANGKPITVPKGSKIGQSDGAAGNVVVPQGSKINPNGTVTAPDGKEVLDANGNPLVLAKGSTIAPDGTVLGPNGKTIPLQTQLLTDEEAAYASQGTSLLTTNLPSSLAALQTSVPTSGGVQVTDGGTGLGQTALERSGLASGTTTLGGGTATTSTDGIGTTTGTTTGSTDASTNAAAGEEMPMMPMSGMSGAANGQQGGQDRQRTTWLAEEEEVWGTQIDTVHGTIGR